jgi:hypothetical protein
VPAERAPLRLFVAIGGSDRRQIWITEDLFLDPLGPAFQLRCF